MSAWVASGLLAGAYVANPNYLTHAVRRDKDGRAVAIACGKARLYSVADRGQDEPLGKITCPRCAARMIRTGFLPDTFTVPDVCR